MVFTGTYEHAIDAKNRLAIPSEIRSQIQRSLGLAESDTITLFVTPEKKREGGAGPALALYTEPDFERRAMQLDSSERAPDPMLDYEEILFSLSKRAEIDKQGRIRLPENLLKRAGLGSDAVLLGVKDRLVIRDRAMWYDYLERRLEQDPDLLMNPRQAMR